MTNRIKQLRKENKMTQAELAEKLGVSPQAVGTYERGSRKVSSKMLDKLAEIFNKPAGYIAGEPSKDDVIRFLMVHYNVRDKQHELDEIFSTSWLWGLWRKVDDYFIGNGIVSYDVQKDDNLLSKDQANDFSFWKEKFSWLNTGYDYLANNYGKVPEKTLVSMLSAAIGDKNEDKVYPHVDCDNAGHVPYDNTGSEWEIMNSEFMERIIKRKKFLLANTAYYDKPEFVDPQFGPQYAWDHTWNMGLPVVEIE